MSHKQVVSEHASFFPQAFLVHTCIPSLAPRLEWRAREACVFLGHCSNRTREGQESNLTSSFHDVSFSCPLRVPLQPPEGTDCLRSFQG